MSSSKAITGLVTLLFVTIVCVGAIYLVNEAAQRTFVSGLEKEISLFVNNEDRGSEIVSLMDTTKSDQEYAELLGNLAAGGEMNQGIKDMLEKTSSKLVVRNRTGDFLGSYGMDDRNVQGFKFAEIALPGLMKGEVGIK